MASESLEDVLTNSGVDSNITNALMMEGWTCQTFRMAAADSQGFEDVLHEWSSSHTLTTCQKACLRTAFQSLQPQQGTTLTPALGSSSTPTTGSWVEAFPPKLENSVLLAMKQKFISNYPSELLHADVFPSTRLELGTRSAHQEIMEMDSMEVSYLPHQVRRDFREQGTKNAQIGQSWSSCSFV